MNVERVSAKYFKKKLKIGPLYEQECNVLEHEYQAHLILLNPNANIEEISSDNEARCVPTTKLPTS